MAKKKHDNKPGPEPDTLKIEGDWEKAAQKAMAKPKPPGGWPKPEKPPKPANDKPAT